VTPTTAEGLARLSPVEPGGVHSFGHKPILRWELRVYRDHPRKGPEVSEDPKTEIQILSYGFSRAKKGFMAEAPVPAAEMALRDAGLRSKT